MQLSDTKFCFQVDLSLSEADGRSFEANRIFFSRNEDLNKQLLLHKSHFLLGRPYFNNVHTRACRSNKWAVVSLPRCHRVSWIDEERVHFSL